MTGMLTPSPDRERTIRVVVTAWVLIGSVQLLLVAVALRPVEFAVFPTVVAVGGTVAAILLREHFPLTDRRRVPAIAFSYAAMTAAGAMTALTWAALFGGRPFVGFGNPDIWGAAAMAVAVPVAIIWPLGLTMIFRMSPMRALRVSVPVLVITGVVMVLTFILLTAVAVQLQVRL